MESQDSPGDNGLGTEIQTGIVGPDSTELQEDQAGIETQEVQETPDIQATPPVTNTPESETPAKEQTGGSPDHTESVVAQETEPPGSGEASSVPCYSSRVTHPPLHFEASGSFSSFCITPFTY